MPRLTNVGKMNDRIDFYTLETKKDSWGEKVTTKKLKHSCWCTVRTQFLKEVQATIGTVLENTTTFIIRYDQPFEIKNEWEIEWGSKQYKIIQINPNHSGKDFTTVIAKVVS